MPSTATLNTLTDRVEQLLLDTANAIFTTGLIAEALRLALEEYSRSRPLEVVGTVTPAVGTREVALTGLTGLLELTRVWFPYDASDPEYPPEWVGWKTFWSGGTPTLFLDVADDPDGSDVARVFYKKSHTLNGLDSATASTFAASDDGLLVLGGAGYSCLARGADLNETAANMAVSTPNYAALANLFLSQFREQLNSFSSRGVKI